MDEQLYEIQDGVRRAKAAWLCGHETIPAQISDDLQVVELPLACLRSPYKDFIDTTGPRGADWGLTYRAAQRGEMPPPILVELGGRGPTIADIKVEENELDAFRRAFGDSDN
ncbi:MAG: hypothetical protein ACRYFS_17415 [Janthinobacterium lividum]